MVTISMTSRTSITSISGVVFISTMTSLSPPGDPTLIDIARFLSFSNSEYRLFRVGNEADLQNGRSLQVGEHSADRFEARLAVAADVDFRLWYFHSRGFQHVEQLVIANRRVVPIIVPTLVDRDGDVFRLGDGHDIARHGKRDRHRFDHHRDC